MSNSKTKKNKNTELDNELMENTPNVSDIAQQKEEDAADFELIKNYETKINELNDKYLRLAAEYDNFRKRSAKEKESIYADAFAAVISAFLPALDNLERALASAEESPLKEGVAMTLKQFTEVLAKLGVSEIDTSDKKFNPEYHNAIMHTEDENFGENEIVDIFQKGYIMGDRVIRYTLVKVAN